ncbi:5-(carboxyamino)imidazole ribonucleotide synthase [Aquiluna sp. Uisw_065]|jgi:5-(carboxyamino)imidazole ribonucleotide synthase|uniref:5-(carboxyamino)imidazole ribonucleotide synthase n=1 Tax=Aquiluna sp. Uisw_065 TaxID=3230967 RepID=UPI0039EA96FA
MPTVGVIGGGQLARMMQPAAIAMGIELRVFAEQEGSSAHYATTQVGDYTDFDQLARFVATVDVITFDHEHVPLALLEKLVATGVKVRPGPAALHFAQNKLAMRAALADLGLPLPIWAAAKTAADIDNFIVANGPEVVVKTPIGGYDGKGVRVISQTSQVSDWLENIEDFGGALLCEQKVPFIRELAQLVSRNHSGELRAWDTVQTVQRDGVCLEVIAPAPGPVDSLGAKEIAKKIARDLEVVGVMAVEMFETASGKLLVNELAMRPHNSGHFSIEGSKTSQFEQHLRAVLDLPLGDTGLVGGGSVMVNLLGVDSKKTLVENYSAAMAKFPHLKFHSYQKEPRRGRKMGHITALGQNHLELLTDCHEAAELLYQSDLRIK